MFLIGRQLWTNCYNTNQKPVFCLLIAETVHQNPNKRLHTTWPHKNPQEKPCKNQGYSVWLHPPLSKGGGGGGGGVRKKLHHNQRMDYWPSGSHTPSRFACMVVVWWQQTSPNTNSVLFPSSMYLSTSIMSFLPLMCKKYYYFHIRSLQGSS
jgi:hypothetical protein